MKRFRWTQERDQELLQWIHCGVSSSRAAKEMGISQSSAKKRSLRMGVHFKRRYTDLSSEGHRAVDERSAELLRAAGVRI